MNECYKTRDGCIFIKLFIDIWDFPFNFKKIQIEKMEHHSLFKNFKLKRFHITYFLKFSKKSFYFSHMLERA